MHSSEHFIQCTAVRIQGKLIQYEEVKNGAVFRQK